MILHHCIDARSFRPLWALEELDLDYELVMHPFPPRAAGKQYLSVNSLGTVPAFIDGDVLMTESSAICQYLAEKHPQAKLNVAADDPEYGNYLNALHYGEATLTFPQTLVLRYARFEAPERRQPQVAADYSQWFLSRLRRLNQLLDGRDYLCGDRFTVADISVGYALLLGEQIELSHKYSDIIQAYWQRLQERDAFGRAKSTQKEAAIAQGVSPEFAR